MTRTGELARLAFEGDVQGITAVCETLGRGAYSRESGPERFVGAEGRGEDESAVFGNALTPLHWAAFGGHPRAIEKLLALGFEVNVADAFGQTAAHTAARDGHVKALKTLVEAGCDLSLSDDRGFSPLHVSAQQGHCEAVTLLVTLKPEMLDAGDARGDTALHWACAQGHAQVVLALLQANAALNVCDSAGCTALHYAASSGKAHVVDLLLAYGDGSQLLCRTRAGLFPHQVADARHPLAASLQARFQRERLACVLSCGASSLWRGALAAAAGSVALHGGYWLFYARRWAPVKRGAFVGGMLVSLWMHARCVFLPPFLSKSRGGSRHYAGERRPIRSKICKELRWRSGWRDDAVVIERFDHYCPWLHNAIGAGNHRCVHHTRTPARPRLRAHTSSMERL